MSSRPSCWIQVQLGPDNSGPTVAVRPEFLPFTVLLEWKRDAKKKDKPFSPFSIPFECKTDTIKKINPFMFG